MMRNDHESKCLTVIIPCFNEENTIREVLVKVLEQSQVGEVIVIDDCSTDSSVEKIGGHGQKSDAFKGIDLIVNVSGKKHTAQVKPFSSIKKEGDKITVLNTGNVKPYNVDWMIFINTKSNKILIIENNPIESRDQYVFNASSLIHEID